MEEYQDKLWNYEGTGIKKSFSWREYNQSQTKEKILFLNLLNGLCECIEPNKGPTVGRRPRSIPHRIFCMALKTYLNTSSRRLISDLELAKKSKFINQVPCFNSVCNYFNDSYLKSVLKYLIELSALPLSKVERKFGVDSSGISSHKMEPWSRARQKHALHRNYRKIHIIYGLLTNIAVSCVVTSGNRADSPHFEGLLKRAADNFNFEEVSADKAYSSKHNLQCASDLGAIAYIPFKKNTVCKGVGLWRQMFDYFKNHQEEFLKHYHLRSNVESGFWMIKKKFGEYVQFKNDIAQENEILCKVLCHNICCLIQEIFLQKIEVNFHKESLKFVVQK